MHICYGFLRSDAWVMCMVRLWSAIMAVAAVLAFAPAAAAQGQRIALVITNQNYTQAGARLTNTHRDGDLIKAALEQVGFRVTVVRDTPNEGALLAAIAEHVARLSAAGPDAVGFLYYSGHGAADRPNGENYLIPTSAPLTHVNQLPLLGVKLEKITEALAKAGRMSFVVFDACRNVPLQRDDKSPFKGFAPVREQSGLLVAFATEPGNVAVDQSLYARALSEEMVRPGQEAGAVFRRVRLKVREDTKRQQSPEYLDKRDHDFQFAAPQPAEPQGSGAAEVVRLCREISGITSPATLAALERQHKGTPVADCISARMGELRAEEAANKQAAAKADEQARADAAKRKADEDAKARADAERQRVALLAKQEEDRRRAEAAAAEKRRADEEAAARAKAETDARVRAEAARREPALSVVPGSGQSFRDRLADGSECAFCPEMVVVPAGSFMMGSPESEAERRSAEGPQRRVTIAKPFAVGKFEVTFAEWDACVAGRGCQSNRSPSDEGWGKDRRPVINVSWNDAKNYVAWLSRTTGKTYRLLSEAEWEYAARAGTTTPFSFGATISTDQANYDGNYTYGSGRKGVNREKTVEAGSLNTPNAWGLHDMHGNVWEWVEDCWHNNHSGAPTDGSAWTTACAEVSRVLRGGSWGGNPQYLRSAFRVRNQPDLRIYFIGFRLARTLNP
jgi:formylglycine-generating enzyme required for sulfatase activity